jgi:glyoxylase-like metal-dependent hydrolase (beta-lactamase superfamily II)
MDAITVGSLQVLPVFDGTARLNASMFTTPDDESADWGDYADALDDAGEFVVPVGGYLVRTGGRIVLLDAGIGDVTDEMFSGGELLRSLAALGVASDDIDTVFVSHLHSDHMGWLEHHGAPTFANAAVHIGAADWAYFVDEAGGGRRRAARLRTVESRVSLVDTDGFAIAPGVTARMTPGHTPGHMSAVISDAGERLIMLGDLVHCPAQLTEVEWQFLYDVDRTLAARTRATMLHEAEDPHTSLLPCHFPGMRSARLIAADAERRWVVA